MRTIFIWNNSSNKEEIIKTNFEILKNEFWVIYDKDYLEIEFEENCENFELMLDIIKDLIVWENTYLIY